MAKKAVGAWITPGLHLRITYRLIANSYESSVVRLLSSALSTVVIGPSGLARRTGEQKNSLTQKLNLPRFGQHPVQRRGPKIGVVPLAS
ncbi:MAG: hypothetical protein JO182_16175 [Acidobacteriaceae bacterium]|nr:hypothetical protein [Acidobacteriaceae bacterium]MBV9227115.1 hypothetical protein [Acidobacteriaceae bacterium]